jgi:hypothetical protein
MSMLEKYWKHILDVGKMLKIDTVAEKFQTVLVNLNLHREFKTKFHLR